MKNSEFFYEHTWIFPHDGEVTDSRESLKAVDLFIAEVSQPGTGLGIEIGLASAYGKRILCISKKWAKISSSLKFVTKDFIECENTEDMVYRIWDYLKNF